MRWPHRPVYIQFAGQYIAARSETNIRRVLPRRRQGILGQQQRQQLRFSVRLQFQFARQCPAFARRQLLTLHMIPHSLLIGSVRMQINPLPFYLLLKRTRNIFILKIVIIFFKSQGNKSIRHIALFLVILMPDVRK